MAISRDEWLAALGDAVQSCDPDALTVAEIAQQFKLSPNTAIKRVRELVAAGKAAQTVKMTTRGRVTAYRLLPPAKKAKRAA